jgi:hypothetical protein
MPRLYITCVASSRIRAARPEGAACLLAPRSGCTPNGVRPEWAACLHPDWSAARMD